MIRPALLAILVIFTAAARAEPWTGGFYRGIGEFHVYGKSADMKVVKDIVDFSVEKGLVLHAHCDEEALWRELSYRMDVADERRLSSAWKALFARHPTRFVVGSDSWINPRWESYSSLMAGYREWLGDLPSGVAERIAWRNASELLSSK